MKKTLKKVILILTMVMIFSGFSLVAFASTANNADSTEVTTETETEETTESEDSATGSKAIAAAVAIGLASAGGAIGMGLAIAKSVEGISRQPEATGKIQTNMMLGLVFIETAIIYALIVAILVIFVL
ncbi:MAG: ATP synthase F0 subunit C [Lachnospiraceae bacterium]|nr:ATP synthase F0 subunit C [Lachnospiraceae bacterium]